MFKIPVPIDVAKETFYQWCDDNLTSIVTPKPYAVVVPVDENYGENRQAFMQNRTMQEGFAPLYWVKIYRDIPSRGQMLSMAARVIQVTSEHDVLLAKLTWSDNRYGF